MQKLLIVYKNKFGQLKNAYDEIEREKVRKNKTCYLIAFVFRIFYNNNKMHLSNGKQNYVNR